MNWRSPPAMKKYFQQRCTSMKSNWQKLSRVFCGAITLLIGLSIIFGGALSDNKMVSSPLSKRMPGTLEKDCFVHKYNKGILRNLLTPEWRRMTIQYGMDVYALQYWTTNYTKRPTLVSGLVALPANMPSPRGVVSYQHGTETARKSAPSTFSSEVATTAALFAGAGYIFVAADYIGLGISTEIHPYLYAPSTANAVVDMLKASYTFVTAQKIHWPSSLFMTGYSQGGYSTLVAQRALEQLHDARFHVVASAPCSGPYNPLVSMPLTLSGASTLDSLYIAYAINTYTTIYHHSLDSVIKPTYAQVIPSLFDGTHEFQDIMDALPRYPKDFIRDDVMRELEMGTSNWLVRALVENNAYEWAPMAPVRLYYGENDLDVSPQNALFTANYMRQRGSNVQAISVGPYDHGQTAVLVMPKIRDWFDTFSHRL
jgi:pimeloyl-ACP methyl ester carboxylesterase